MDAARWTSVRALFEKVLDTPSTEREAVLREHCHGDPGLLQEVRALLEADAREHTPVEEAQPAVIDLLEPAAFLAEMEHAEAGPYRLLRRLGRGGMGVVYLAERADGAFERTVALKLVHGGMDSDELMRRFHAERRILASLEHPNIARMYDAGHGRSTTSGRGRQPVSARPRDGTHLTGAAKLPSDPFLFLRPDAEDVGSIGGCGALSRGGAGGG